ncbi:hypothetical protein KI387_042566, partial [Taxus chinensis]
LIQIVSASLSEYGGRKHSVVLTKEDAMVEWNNKDSKLQNMLATSWLKVQKMSLEIPTNLVRAEFHEELSDMIVLLSRVMGDPTTKEFKPWIAQFIN